MAATSTQRSLPDQILNPQDRTPPSFTFDNYLARAIPTLGAPSKVTRPICNDYRQSNGQQCPRGPNCPDRHYVPPSERSGIGHLICKHYQRGLCKKGDTCEFAHTFNLRDEKECKEFSRYGICSQGDDCTSLHIPPTSELRRPACSHYARGFCPLGPYCNQRHVKHQRLCPFYMAGFCPNGRAHPPDTDKVVSCEYGAHAKWIKDEDMNPRKPEVRKIKDPEQEKREQEEREDEFYAEEERRRERFEKQSGEGGRGWQYKRGGRGRGFKRRY
ncbi:mRNA 3'-end-processing protein yth-1 [Pseudocercospora fuligena]|uniref:mRNA 3'-end-processing protein n=1 Tax=Pseudocercospora fuligena TaxID=685502 RepID=A0A8H6RQR0_9PEZI|nr:mRNA 3'-end-processing protein yth-1 [Pseudocercospora fuligena]